MRKKTEINKNRLFFLIFCDYNYPYGGGFECIGGRVEAWPGMGSEDVFEILDLWQDGHVAFLLGCSFSFEEASIEAGMVPRHVEEGVNVSMYRTNREATPVGAVQRTFGGQHAADSFRSNRGGLCADVCVCESAWRDCASWRSGGPGDFRYCPA